MMMNRRRNENRTVYSTEQGRICPDCGQPVDKCKCKKGRSIQSGDGIVRVRLESKGRRGKTVTTISGILLDHDALKKIAGELKTVCGAGGAVKDGVIEIQGDHANLIIAELKKRSFTVKRAGG
jgi:translation initiation factor 1